VTTFAARFSGVTSFGHPPDSDVGSIAQICRLPATNPPDAGDWATAALGASDTNRSPKPVANLRE
jgi:hypothetical protein